MRPYQKEGLGWLHFLNDFGWGGCLADETQAIDRTHRIGQDKKVIACRLITRNTLEAKIIELQRSKRELADAIITSRNSVVAELNARESFATLVVTGDRRPRFCDRAFPL